MSLPKFVDLFSSVNYLIILFSYYCIQYMFNVIFIIYDEIKFAVVKQAS